MSTVIQFPTNRSSRILKVRQQETRRIAFFATVSSIVGLMMFAQMKVEVNHNQVSYALNSIPQEQATTAQRAIASIEPMNSKSQISSAEKFVISINENVGRNPASFASSLGAPCVGAICSLGPNYRMVYQNGFKGAALEGLLDEGGRGRPISDSKKILTQFIGKAVVDYDAFEVAKSPSRSLSDQNKIKVWELKKSGSEASAGIAVISEFDDQIRSIVFCPSDSGPADSSACLKQIE